MSTKVKQRLISSPAAAAMLGMTAATLRACWKRGAVPLPFTQVSSTAYFRLSDVEHFCEVGTWPKGMAWAKGEGEDQADGD